MNNYERRGYASRAEYLADVAKEHNVDLDVVIELARVLGPEEDFDGLLNILEDA